MIGFMGIGRHKRLRTLLSSYMDGQVSPAEAKRVEEHLLTCDECRRDIETLRMSVEMLGELPELEIPRSFALTSPPESVVSTRRFAWSARLATTAAALLLAALVAGDVLGILKQTGPADGEEAEVLAVPEVAPAAAIAATESSEEAAVMMAVPAAPPPVVPQLRVPPIAVAAAQAEDLADEGVVTSVPGEGVEERAVEEREFERALTPSPVAASTARALHLPLRQLELATAVLLGMLLVATLWLSRRRRSSP